MPGDNSYMGNLEKSVGTRLGSGKGELKVFALVAIVLA